MVAYVPNTMLNTGQGQRRKNNMNADELADLIEFDAPIMGLNKEAATMLRQQQAEIERLTTKNLEWLANWNEQQAEIEALKAIINEAFKSIPAMGEDGEFYHEHHGMDGEYLGYENIPANYVVQVIEAILRKASENERK
jgi:hypothetical protein